MAMTKKVRDFMHFSIKLGNLKIRQANDVSNRGKITNSKVTKYDFQGEIV